VNHFFEERCYYNRETKSILSNESCAHSVDGTFLISGTCLIGGARFLGIIRALQVMMTPFSVHMLPQKLFIGIVVGIVIGVAKNMIVGIIMGVVAGVAT